MELNMEPNMELNVAGLMERSVLNGPGVRTVVWLQGCPRRPRSCPGCFNPEMIDTDRTADRVPVEDLASAILATRGIEGVTFSGGEPFYQAGPLAALAARVGGGLTVVTFTGYTLKEIREAGREDWDALLDRTDLLVDGPYVAELRTPSPLRGSSNQRFHFLSGKILPSDIARMPPADVELVLTTDGRATLTGFPETGFPFQTDGGAFEGSGRAPSSRRDVVSGSVGVSRDAGSASL